jgi:uncharacterized repeat protein (TIGR01451 family)
MWNKFKALAFAGMFLFLLATPVIAQICAFPGKDGVNTAVSSVVNTYYAGVDGTTASGTSVTLGTIRDASKPAIAVGDLIILMQMQSGNGVSFANSFSYGSGVDAVAGRYEYATVKTISGSTLTLAASLANTYTQSVSSRQTFQIIRVPQYSSATVSGTLTAPAWNGTTGGVVALDTTGTLTFSGTIDVSGLGFRGGAGLQKTGDTGITSVKTDYYYSSTSTFNGMKGEGIAGTPLKVNDGSTTAAAGADNYTNGSIGRGAPGNAGGGSNDFGPNVDNGLNAGGGGGSNGGAGGIGGNNWHNNSAANGYLNGPGGTTSLGYVQGGLGGSAFLATSAQIVMGGGGGAGDGNNSDASNQYKMSGGNGGGIVLIRAGAIAGGGTINANGNSALDLPLLSAMPNQTDAGGGGGAGGSIVIWSANGTSGLAANAKGGKGGNPGYFEHGPGGGGGGGFIASNGGVSTSITKGLSGLDQSPTPKKYGAADGTDGITTTLVTTVGTPAGAGCLPSLSVTKSTSTPGPFPSGGTATYTIQVTNAATAGTAKGVRISDLRLPSGFSYASAGTFTASTGIYLTGTTTAPTALGANLTTKPAAAATSLNWDSLDIPAGGTVSITFTVNIAGGTADGTYHNPAAVAYSDPTRSTAGRVLKPFTNATTSTANSGTAFTTNTSYETGSFSGSVGGSNYDGTTTGLTTENVVISSVPTIALVKSCTAPATCETANQLPGTDLTYKIVFSNTGGIAAQKLVIVDPIPTSTDYQVSPGAAVTTSAGLTFVIEYSSDSGVTWTYTPTSGAGGASTNYDRTITHIRWRATAGNLSAGTPGDVTFTVKIR